MATQKKKTRARRKKRSWLIAKILLLFVCAVLIVFIGAIFMMEKELHRIGFFGNENAAVHSPAQPQAPFPEAATRGTTSPSRASEEITREDKKRLDDVLRARGGQQE
jgi:flagellar basal body-associated protein FliL